jgi:hypothetical protein
MHSICTREEYELFLQTLTIGTFLLLEDTDWFSPISRLILSE